MQSKIAALFRRGDSATTNDGKGSALEEIVQTLFADVPGVPRELIQRDSVNPHASQEIDIALWNDQDRLGLPFLPFTLLFECKNWATAVGASEIDSFFAKLADRRCDVGILVAAAGITGQSSGLTSAHERIANALLRGHRIIVITRRELLGLRSTAEVIRLLKMKLTLLAAKRTSI